MKVAVIGGGLGGLSAACHLAGRGHDVVVHEAAARPGGRAGLLSANGYTIDTGPTVLTMPDLLDATLRAAGSSLDDHLQLVPLDPLYRACFADGSVIHVRRDRDAMVEEVRAQCGAKEADAFVRFAAWLTELAALEMPHFIERNYDSPLDLTRSWRALVSLVRLGALQRVASKVGSFFDDERLQRVFSFQAMYAGLSPYEALAVFCVITYMDTVAGVYFPRGGMHGVAAALADAAKGAGAQIEYGSKVVQIVRAPGGAVRGVQLESGAVETADAVVCNADLPVAYRTLLDMEPPFLARRGRYSPSCVVWAAGVRGTPPADAAHHNLHFGAPWKGAFDALLKDGTRMPDPSLLVTVPSLTDPSLAPDGRSALYVLEPVPNLDGNVDWVTEQPRVREQLEARVAALGYPVDVEVEQVIGPLDWQAAGMARGTPFSLAHRFTQSGPFRPANVEKRVPGLVFVGSGTVPGVGVPMVLVSGRLAADRVDEFGARR